jgi:hypothetical protein
MRRRPFILIGIAVLLMIGGIVVLFLMRNGAQTRDEMDAELRQLFRQTTLISVKQDIDYPAVDVIPFYDPMHRTWSVQVFTDNFILGNGSGSYRNGFVYVFLDGVIIAHLDQSVLALPDLATGHHYIAAGLEDTEQRPYINKDKLIQKTIEGDFTEKGTFVLGPAR